MSSPAPRPPRVRSFGPFVFDEDASELRKHGVKVRLQGQPLQILATLIRQPGQVVSRDEFQRQLWKGSTFVDFEHGLNAAMNRLRQTLGDSADEPRYIETLSGRGYRFVAPIQETAREIDAARVLVMAAPSVEAVEPAQPLAPPIERAEKKSWRIWGVAGVLVAAVATGYVAARQPLARSAPPTVRFTIPPPAGYAFEPASSRQAFALSPDGAKLAFTAMDASGVFQGFTRDLDGLESRPLANAKGVFTLFWAPDGRSLFMTIQGKVRRTPLEGDSFQLVSDAPAIMLSGAFVDERNLLLAGRSVTLEVPAAGGTPQALKEIYPWPQLLPDGKHLLYTEFDTALGRQRVRVAIFGEPETAQNLLETDSRAIYAPSVRHPETGYLLSVRAGNLLAHPFDPKTLRILGEPLPIVSRVSSFLMAGSADFSAAENGTLVYKSYVSRSQLAWVTRQGEVVRAIGPGNVNLKQARLSPDGTKIVTTIYDVERGVNDLWVIDSETGAARRVFTGRGTVDAPVWSADSHKLLYCRAYGAPPKLYVRGLGEQAADEPLPTAYFQEPTDWSRDGRFIAWTNTAFAQIANEMQGEVWLMDMMGKPKPIRLSGTSNHESSPTFSPDGRWLAFTSNESGRTEVYLQAFETGEKPGLTGERHLVSRRGALCLRWRRDGRELYYLAFDGKVYAIPITLSPKVKIGEAAPLFPIGIDARSASHSGVGFDVSPDGQRFLVPIVTSQEKSEIVVIQNWETAALRRSGKLN